MENGGGKMGDITRYLSNELEVPYGSWENVISYVGKKGETLFKHFSTHSTWTIKSSAKKERLRRSQMQSKLQDSFEECKVVDAVLNTSGHAHQIVVCEPEDRLVLRVENGQWKQDYINGFGWDGFGETTGEIDPDKKFYLCCGSFYKNTLQTLMWMGMEFVGITDPRS